MRAEKKRNGSKSLRNQSMYQCLGFPNKSTSETHKYGLDVNFLHLSCLKSEPNMTIKKKQQKGASAVIQSKRVQSHNKQNCKRIHRHS